MPRNEAETRTQLIYPALQARGWPADQIGEERNAGPIYKVGRRYRRGQARVDYLLQLKITGHTKLHPVAVIEAKAENASPIYGIEQGKAYAKRMNVLFVYSTNGYRFVEYDDTTGQTSAPQPMSAFPSPAELRRRYEAHMGFTLGATQAEALLTPYSMDGSDRRYYQDAAIRAALEKIAGGGNRVLLALATGAGKTFIAVHLLKRLMDAGQITRALFVCDRTELRDQAVAAFQKVFGADAQAVGSNNARKNARILVATYQTLDVDQPEDAADAEEEKLANFLLQNYPPNYFSHVIIDECHRSAWGKWSKVLTHNAAAVQIGLTATPRQLAEVKPRKTARNAELVAAIERKSAADAQITSDNLRYFGEPVYEYTLTQGNADGYLAVAELIDQLVNIDDTGLTIADVLARNPVDAITGQPVTEEYLRDLYSKTSYENQIRLPDRVLVMCADLFQQLLSTGGPHQKTIIYCVRDDHAKQVTAQLTNLYRAWCMAQGQTPKDAYSFVCTQSASGNDQLPDFKKSKQSHFIATTVELLTTGVDVPVARNIVFFRYLQSPISFYQMIGRGTRITDDKLFFRIYDYTDVMHLFGQAFITKPPSIPLDPPGGGDGGDADLPPDDGDEDDRPDPVIIEVSGFDVQVTNRGKYIIEDVNGQATPIRWEEYKARIAATVKARAPDVAAFRTTWIDPVARQTLIRTLPRQGRSLYLVRDLDELDDYDLFDVLAQLTYQTDRQTRAARAAAFSQNQATWLAALGAQPARLIQAMVNQFAADGTEALESQELWNTPEVARAGGLALFMKLDNAADTFRQMKARIFAA